MAKLWYLLCFLLFNIIYTINEDINSFSNINSTNNIRFLKSSPKKKKYFFHNKTIRILLVVISIVIGGGGGILHAIRNPGSRGPDISDWEYLFRRNSNRNREEREILKKKKKYYLLNNEIKGFIYKKENCNNEEECPICLENYSDEKKVCFTPCKHLFHHICLKEYIYGCDEMKCPICKFDMWNCLKDKKINYSKIKIKEEIFQIKKNSKKNKNNLINSNNVTLNSNNNDGDININIPVEN